VIEFLIWYGHRSSLTMAISDTDADVHKQLDYDLIAANPKPIMVTSYHSLYLLGVFLMVHLDVIRAIVI
jgi:hypothetical protein